MSDALPAHTGSQERSATGMRSARRCPRLKHQEAIVAGARNVPLRRSYLYVRRAAPPTVFLSPRQPLPRWSVMCAIRRDYQRHRLSQETVYSTTAPHATSHATTNPLHGAHDVLRDCDVASCTQ
jgi:hypothetical protein